LPSSQAINISSVENSAPQPMQRIIFPFIIQEIVFGPRTLSMLSSDLNHPHEGIRGIFIREPIKRHLITFPGSRPSGLKTM
jgi:hypothetical protein